ncbi:MAG: tRNA preQ1(34) S-adenosylmethionine ribosyltransferase-isomerase QueA [Paracoccaceae bacterium]
MNLSDFDFDLPEHLIATRPARPRSAARMLVATRDAITDAHAYDLPNFLRPGDRLILNDTKVIPARLFGTRTRTSSSAETTARIEVTLLQPTPQGYWRALIKPLKKLREGEFIRFSDKLSARLIAKKDAAGVLEFNLAGKAFDTVLAQTGAMPLPPYIAAKRAADAQDTHDYQSIWARRAGAVAAPNASLHFDQDLLVLLGEAGVAFSHVTLHVGEGTFAPVKVKNIRDHKMHAEWGEISPDAAAEINQTRATGGRVIPVGTTALRLIETAADATGHVQAWRGDTDIFILPGFQFCAADALLTNFHLPKSTLMMLVSAFMGANRIRDIYRHAISAKYRFFSYGDASLLVPGAESRRT